MQLYKMHTHISQSENSFLIYFLQLYKAQQTKKMFKLISIFTWYMYSHDCKTTLLFNLSNVFAHSFSRFGNDLTVQTLSSQSRWEHQKYINTASCMQNILQKSESSVIPCSSAFHFNDRIQASMPNLWIITTETFYRIFDYFSERLATFCIILQRFGCGYFTFIISCLF